MFGKPDGLGGGSGTRCIGQRFGAKSGKPFDKEAGVILACGSRFTVNGHRWVEFVQPVQPFLETHTAQYPGTFAPGISETSCYRAGPAYRIQVWPRLGELSDDVGDYFAEMGSIAARFTGELLSPVDLDGLVPKSAVVPQVIPRR